MNCKRVLIVHNEYLQPGGEDYVFKTEKRLLEEMGHEVILFLENNSRLNVVNPFYASMNAIWSLESQRKIRLLIKENKPDICHFHNTFLLISPAAYYTCKEAGIPVVQTLHNYRIMCPGALLMRGGHVCEDCLDKILPWPGIKNGCWRGSQLKTSVVAAMLIFHRLIRTWTEKVDCYIALTKFARRKFIEWGLPKKKIIVKPNFVYPLIRPKDNLGKYALFVGRISQEKGILGLLHAWKWLEGIPLKIVGDGPLRKRIERVILRERLRMIDVLGQRKRKEVFQLMREARFLILPSQWYEGFPLTIVEAFACGLPVITSRLGAMAEIVEDDRTGLLFEPGDPEDLAAKVQWAWTHPKEIAEMGKEARREYEEKYTPEKNYERLMNIYRLAIEMNRK